MDQDKITYFGETDSRSKRALFGIKAKDRTKHVYVIGKTGMGKSTMLENMAIQDIQNGNGTVFIDPHGGTAEKFLDYIPEDRIKDVLYFAPFDLEYPVSFNVMEDIGPDSRHLVANGLMSAFKKLFGEESFSDRMQYILQNTILALLEYPGATMLGINKMLVDKAYRDKVVANVTDSSVKTYWTKEFAGYTERFAAEAIPAIQNKIGQFTSNPLIRNIIGQPKSTFDIREFMDQKKIIIVNLSKGRVGEGNANLLGSMLITKIYLAAMSRADKNNAELAKLPNFYLYVDEFQSFANESFADILSEARKYKLNLTIAHQYIEQMEEEVRDAVFGNVGTMIAFRVGAYDAEVLEKEFAPTFIAEDLVNLGMYQVYLKLMIDGVSSKPFSATTMAPIKAPDITFKKEVIESSRAQFAHSRSEVEKTIAEWQGEAKPEAHAFSGLKHDDYKGKKDVRRDERPLEPRRDTQYIPKAFDPRAIKEEKQIKKEVVSSLPSDDFKPLTSFNIPKAPQPLSRSTGEAQKVSLENLKPKQQSNQRQPSKEHMSDLRNVLAGMIKTEPKVVDKKPEPQTPHVSKKQEPSPEELKKILGVDE
ncbi:MAG: type IV secretion system DNA-binding domain-containing protein [Minisyncoccia bacterium]